MLKIRLVEINDANEYRKLRNDNYQWFFSQKRFTREEVRDWITGTIDSRDNSVYVCEDTNTQELVGTVSIYNVKEDSAEIGRIIVNSQRKGEGIGLVLLREMEQYAGLRGLEILWAEVMKDNLASKNLFLKAGYKLVQENNKKYTFERPVRPITPNEFMKGLK